MDNESIKQKIERIKIMITTELRPLCNKLIQIDIDSVEFEITRTLIAEKIKEIRVAEKELHEIQQIGAVKPIPSWFWWLVLSVIVTWALFVFLLLQKSHP